MAPYFSEKFGNAGSLHSFGQEAIAALDAARETIAASIKAGFREIIFTGSATEANNIVLRGVLKNINKKTLRGGIPKIIISAIEHESILETARDVEKAGTAEVVYVPVSNSGVVDLKKLASNLDENTVLISVMYANNEIGAVQPIVEIGGIINKFKNKYVTHKPQLNNYPLFHTDAAQAFQFFDCDVTALGVDFMTLSSHKIYGPKGAGALYIATGHRPPATNTHHKTTPRDSLDGYWLPPIITGGGQEFGLRSGTENIPAIVGFAKAVEIIVDSRKPANKRIAELRGELWGGIRKIVPKMEINGDLSRRRGDPLHLPSILNVYFPHHAAQDLLTKFDLIGLAASSGSACNSRAPLTSYVIRAIGYSKERAESSVRFSLGRPTTKEEIVQALAIIRKINGAKA